MAVLITGGAGFIGANTADRLLSQSQEVVLLDNLSRPGSADNLAWLRQRHGDLEFARVDVRDFSSLKEALARYKPLEVILHFAAQVAVTASVADPLDDFATNAAGTLNVLEAVRQLGLDPVVLYSSTNKVYGAIEQVQTVEEPTRFRYADLPYGVPESMPLDFHSPYGCSKGAADQYVRDYRRIFGLRTIVFRNSCIYGPRQFGIEDQGWLAWFVIAGLRGLPITIYGNGKQVRDVLFIDDLIEAMLMAVDRADTSAGQIYNLGGGPANSLAVWSEFGPILEGLLGRPLPVRFGDWRPGDQRVYISDIRKMAGEFGWAPKVEPRVGIGRLFEWASENQDLFTHLQSGVPAE